MSTKKIIDTLQDFADRLDRLENVIKDPTNVKYHFDIQIKDLHLNELNLEELAFHLEKLNIKELSGMLNLGNTFSPKVHSKEKLDEPQLANPFESAETENSDRDIQILINGNPVSYSLIDGKDKNDE